jgi:hypothetical protein
MPKSLFATFTSSDTFSQHLYSEVAAKFLAVLCRAVNSNGNAVNSYILDSLCQCLAGESDEAQFQATGQGLFCFKVDGHPNRSRVKGKKAVKPDCGPQANDAIGYALAREHYLALKVRGKIPTCVKPSPNLRGDFCPDVTGRSFPGSQVPQMGDSRERTRLFAFSSVDAIWFDNGSAPELGSRLYASVREIL